MTRHSTARASVPAAEDTLARAIDTFIDLIAEKAAKDMARQQ